MTIINVPWIKLPTARYEQLKNGTKGIIFKLSLQYVAKVLYKLDEEQLKDRSKFPLTGVDVYFSTIESNIAFKEEYLKSDKDIEDAKHLRLIYKNKVDENKIKEIKEKIKRYRYGKR